MYSLPLSGEQKTLLQKSNDAKLQLVEYYDHDNAVRSILAKLYQNVVQTKTSLVVVEKSQKEHYHHLLNSLGLGKMVIKSDHSGAIPYVEANQWRSQVVKDIDTLNEQIESALSTHKLEKEKVFLNRNQLTKQYRKLSSKALGNKSLANLAHTIAFKRVSPQSLASLDSLDESLYRRDQAEWQQLASAIEKAKGLYNSDYQYLSDLLMLSDHYLANHSIDDIIVELKSIIETLSNEVHHYQQMLHRYKQELHAFFRETQLRASNLVESLIIQLNHSSKDNTTLAFDDLNALLDKLGIAPVNTSKTEGNTGFILAELVTVKDQLANAHELTQKRIRQYISRVKTTDLSVDDTDTLSRIGERSQRLNKLFKSDHLSLKAEDAALSKQTKITDCITALKKQLYVINAHQGLIKWKQFLLTQSLPTRQVITALRSLPVHLWQDTAQSWYYKAVLRKQTIEDQSSYQPIKTFIKELHQLDEQRLSLLSLTLSKTRHTAIKKLKSKHSSIYSTLIRKKIDGAVLLTELMLASDAFLSGLYPIILVDELEFNSLKYAKSAFVDELIFSDSEIINKIDLSTLHLADQVTIFSPVTSRLSKDMQVRPYLKGDAATLLSSSQVPENLHSEDLENMSIVKKVSKTLLAIQDQIKIYHSKNLSVISCCTGTFDQLISQVVERHGGKELFGTSTSEDRLVEALLSGKKKQYIILQDGLINSDKIDELRYQLDIIAKVNTLGISLIDLWTADALQTNHRSNISKIESMFKQQKPVSAKEQVAEISE